MDSSNTYTHDKWFRRAIKELDLNASEQALYYTLREFWNINRWQDTFSLWDEDVEKAMNVVHNTMKKARDGCIAKASAHGCTLFTFAPGIGRGKKGRYEMIPYIKALNTDSFIDSFSDYLTDNSRKSNEGSISGTSVKESDIENGVTAYIKTVNTQIAKEQKTNFNNNDNKLSSSNFEKNENGAAAALPVEAPAGSIDPSPVAAAPSPELLDLDKERPIAECLSLYLTHAHSAIVTARESLITAKVPHLKGQPAIDWLRKMAEAFNTHLISSLKTDRTLRDWVSHFYKWAVEWKERPVTPAKSAITEHKAPVQQAGGIIIPLQGATRVQKVKTKPVDNGISFNENGSFSPDSCFNHLLHYKHSRRDDISQIIKYAPAGEDSDTWLNNIANDFNKALKDKGHTRRSFNNWVSTFHGYVKHNSIPIEKMAVG